MPVRTECELVEDLSRGGCHILDAAGIPLPSLDCLRKWDWMITHRDADYGAGEAMPVVMHDGSRVLLRKLAADYDPTDRLGAMDRMQREAAHGELLTGLLYIDPLATDLHTALNTAAAPLNTLASDTLCPGSATLAKINAALR